MRFDSSESDNDDHSQFPAGGWEPSSSSRNRKASLSATPKSRPILRRPKRVQFGPDEPDEDEQPRPELGKEEFGFPMAVRTSHHLLLETESDY